MFKSFKLNDFPTISDIYVPIEENKYRFIDTMTFGNKFIYIIYYIADVGKIDGKPFDNTWRVMSNKLKYIENPFLYNQSVISKLSRVVPGLSPSDFKSIVIVNKISEFNPINGSENEFIVSEIDAIKLILNIERESNVDIFDPYDIERYAEAFYRYGLTAENELKTEKEDE